MGHSQLGQILIKRGLLTEADRQTINRTCGATPGAFAKGVLALGLLDENELAELIAGEARLPRAHADLPDTASADAFVECTAGLVESMEFIPIDVDKHYLTAAILDPFDKSTVRRLEFFTGKRIKPVVATLSQVQTYLQQKIENYAPRPTGLEEFLKHHAGDSKDNISKTSGERISLINKVQAGKAVTTKDSTPPTTKTEPKADTADDWQQLERLSQEPQHEPIVESIEELPAITGDEMQVLAEAPAAPISETAQPASPPATKVNIAAINRALWRLETSTSAEKSADIIARAAHPMLVAGIIWQLGETAQTLIGWQSDADGKIVLKTDLAGFNDAAVIAALQNQALGLQTAFACEVPAVVEHFAAQQPLAALLVANKAEQKMVLVTIDPQHQLSNTTFADTLAAALRKIQAKT